MLLNWIKPVWRNLGRVLLPILFIGLVAGCGEQEPKQRSAFITFLQTEIINKNRVNLPVLNNDQVDAFGEYAKQYQILVDFDIELKGMLTPLANSLQVLKSMGSIKDMVESRDKLADILQQLSNNEAKLAELLAKAEKQKSELVQPEEVKTPFDRAYDKFVIQQAEPAKEGFPLLKELFTAALTLVDFVNSKSDNSYIVGNQVEFSSQADVDKFNELNANLQKAQSDYLAFAQKSR